MKRIALTVLFLNVFQLLFAQDQLTYLFNGKMGAKEQNIHLKGESSGNYETVTLPKVNGMKKQVFSFGKNPAITFNNRSANRILDGDYTIELYFQFSDVSKWKKVLDFRNRKSDRGLYLFDGRANVLMGMASDEPVAQASSFVHILMSRNSQTKELTVFAEGKKLFSMQDVAPIATLDDTQLLQLFTDDFIVDEEGSRGKVALFKIYRQALDEDQASFVFEHLEQTLKGEEMTVAVSGQVQDASNGNSISGAQVVLKKGNRKVANTMADAQGNFVFEQVLPSADYVLEANAEGYLEKDSNLVVNEAVADFVLGLNTLAVGRTVKLNNIQFIRNKAEFLDGSFSELDKLVELMRDHPNMEISLAGHTDNLGSAKLSQRLSEDRVEAVKEYLVSNGIDKKRISGKGFGGTKPIASNFQEDTRKLNRRVEMTIKKL